MSPRIRSILVLVGAATWSGCGSPGTGPSPQATPPAVVRSGGVKEADLATITLAPQAEQRLAIETAPVTVGRVTRSRTLAGEVVIPPDRSQLVLSPVAGTLAAEGDLPPAGSAVSKGQTLFRVLPIVPAQRDMRVTAEAELTAASSRLEAAKLRYARAEQMLRDQVGSKRALEEAGSELKQAETAAEAARARVDQIRQAPLDADVSIPIAAPAAGTLRQLLVAPGQKVAAGAPLFEITDYSTLWLRVPIYAGELPDLDPSAAAMVENVGVAHGAG